MSPCCSEKLPRSNFPSRNSFALFALCKAGPVLVRINPRRYSANHSARRRNLIHSPTLDIDRICGLPHPPHWRSLRAHHISVTWSVRGAPTHEALAASSWRMSAVSNPNFPLFRLSKYRSRRSKGAAPTCGLPHFVGRPTYTVLFGIRHPLVLRLCMRLGFMSALDILCKATAVGRFQVSSSTH